MSEEEYAVQKDLLEATTQIVAAYVGRNEVPSSQLSAIIQEIFGSLVGLAKGKELPQEDKLVPAVPIRKSVQPSYIVCLEDGKKLKMLKRHLKTAYNMTPEEYKSRWGLDVDYPMVAPDYAKHRSQLAKNIGLGTKPRKEKRR